jgi:hypothetical protein
MWARVSLSGIARCLSWAAALAGFLTLVRCGPNPFRADEPTGEGATAADTSLDSQRAPGITGSVTGTVKVNGEGMPGVEVLATYDPFVVQNGPPRQSTTTEAGGQYTLAKLESGVFLIQIGNDFIDPHSCKGLPSSEIKFEFTGQVRTVNIQCTAYSGTFVGTLRVSGGDRSHDPFVFNAGDGVDAQVTYRMGRSVDTVIIEGPTFAPSSLPRLSGRLDESGHFTVEGRGIIAGIGEVSVKAKGRLVLPAFFTESVIEIEEIIVGGKQELPKGTPISYQFSGSVLE